MNNFGINGNDTDNHTSTITLRRNPLKKQIITIATAGIAVLVIAGIGFLSSVNEDSVHADTPAKARVMAVAGGSHDLPDWDNYSPAKIVNRAVAGGSPDLPELDRGPASLKARPYTGGIFANTSPDLPEMNTYSPARIANRAVAGGSPDLPELDAGSASPKVRSLSGGTYPNTSPDLPDTF